MQINDFYIEISCIISYARLESLILVFYSCLTVKDFTFSNTEGLNQIPYASAGDCYSALICPQGHFSINLKNTGFKVAKRTKWTVEGSYSNQQINPDDVSSSQ